MPIVSKSTSPRWIRKDAFSINEEEAKHQDIRPLRIGLVNYMQDKAFIATEQDFITPIIEAAGILQFEIILFSPESIPRNKETQDYIDAHYEKVTEKRLRDCDILIQTGTNEIFENGSSFDFKNGKEALEIVKIFELAQKSGVTTQIASCFASQVLALNKYGISVDRVSENKKMIGVFPHEVHESALENFITKNLNSEFNVVFGKNHKLNTEEILNSELLQPLIVSTEEIDKQKEVHLFYDPKELFFGFQGHPEYQRFNILKEYLRDIGSYYRDSEKLQFPEIPPNYLTKKGFKQMQDFILEVKKVAKVRVKFIENSPSPLAPLPEGEGDRTRTNDGFLEKLSKFDTENRPRIEDSIYDEVIQSWKDTGDKIWARIFNATYQLTGFEAGEKLTKKRDISMEEFPLDALI